MEIALRLAEIKIHYRTIGTFYPTITNSKTAYETIRPYFSEAMEHKEFFYAIFLNTNSKVISIMKVSEGGRASTIVDIPIIMQGLILSNATSLIVAHNHPTGNTTPSINDKQITKKIKEACKLLDFNLSDHLILTKDTYTSFADDGLL